MWELTKSFPFEAAHSLTGTTYGKASEEIHGHSFRAEVTLRGTPDPATGMVIDLGLVQRAIVWERLAHVGELTRVSIHRDSCNESCTYYGPKA